MTKARRPKLPADERRCKMNSGKGWRCRLSRFRNYTFCEKHHDYFQQRKADARAKRQQMKKMKPDLEVNNVGVQDGKMNLNKRPGRPKKMKPDLEVNNVGVQDGKLDLNKRPGRPKKMKPDLEVNNVGVQDGKLNLNRRPGRPKKMKPDLEVNNVGVQDRKLNLSKRPGMPKKMKPALKVNSVGVQDGKLNLNKRSRRPKKTKTNLEGVKVEETKRPTKRKRVTKPKQEDIDQGQTSNTSSRNKKKKKKKKRVSPQKKKKESIDEKHNADEGVVRVMELGQIWAFSNESDGGFPCSYARIDRIIPIPSQVEVTPLIPQLVSEEERQFAEHGLSLAHGTFKASESTIVKDIQSFTHKATFEEVGRCSYKIFPRIGEIWAVHWDSNMSRRGFRQFKLVEVVSDFSEEQGVNVFGLVQVEGLSGVYQRQLHEGFYMIRCFSRKFMPMFSHQVPATKIEEGVEMRWKVMFH